MHPNYVTLQNGRVPSLQRARMTASPVEKDKIKTLQNKILLAKGSNKSNTNSSFEHKKINYVWRMVLELVIGMVLGFFIGYGLDQWIGTAPMMMIIMSLLGFAGGISTMMKTAKEFSSIEPTDIEREQNTFGGK